MYKIQINSDGNKDSKNIEYLPRIIAFSLKGLGKNLEVKE
jgi:hypothetical protein